MGNVHCGSRVLFLAFLLVGCGADADKRIGSGAFAGACIGAGAGLAFSRPFLLTIPGAMMAFSTLTELQTGQLTSLRLTCDS